MNDINTIPSFLVALTGAPQIDIAHGPKRSADWLVPTNSNY